MPLSSPSDDCLGVKHHLGISTQFQFLRNKYLFFQKIATENRVKTSPYVVELTQSE